MESTRFNYSQPYFEELDFKDLATKVKDGAHVHTNYTFSSLWERVCDFFFSCFPCFPCCKLADNNAEKVFGNLVQDFNVFLGKKVSEMNSFRNKEYPSLDEMQEKIENMKEMRNIFVHGDNSLIDLKNGKVNVNGTWEPVDKPRTLTVLQSVYFTFKKHCPSDNLDIVDFNTSFQGEEFYLNINCNGKDKSDDKKRDFSILITGEDKDFFLKTVHRSYKNVQDMKAALESAILHEENLCESISRKKADDKAEIQNISKLCASTLDDISGLMKEVIFRKQKYSEKSEEVKKEVKTLISYQKSILKGYKKLC